MNKQALKMNKQALKMNKQALVKLATLRLAINHVLRRRYTTKQAGLFKKKYEKPGWENNEDAVTDFSKDWYKTKFKGYYFPESIVQEAVNAYEADPTRALNAINKYNKFLRYNRHSDQSAALIDRYIDLWDGTFDEAYKPILYKSDRFDALEDAARSIRDDFDRIPEKNREIAQQLLKEIEAYQGKLLPKNLEEGVYEGANKKMLKEPLTRTDVGSIADATPKQLERWNRYSKKSPLWETLWPILTGAGAGAGLSLALPPTTKGEKLNPIIGTLGGGLLGGIYGLIRGADTEEKKRYAERRLNEK